MPSTYVIVTSRQFFVQGIPQPDDALLREALRKRGGQVAIVPWQDDYDWGRADITIIRSSWDWHLEPERYLLWCEQVDTVSTLLNPLEAIRWNTNKWRYFSDLQRAGVPTIPTLLLPRRTRPEYVLTLLDATGWQKSVVKPSVGANSYGTFVLSRKPERLEEHVVSLLQERDMLLQPYLEGVSSQVSHVFLEGEYSHSFAKPHLQVRLHSGLSTSEVERRVDVSSEEIQLASSIVHIAQRILACSLVYARVDLVRDHGQLLLMELELNEPALHLEMNDSCDRLADALVAHVSRSHTWLSVHRDSRDTKDTSFEREVVVH